MNWFNYYGLAAVVIILIPNIIYACTNKVQNENKFDNKAFAITEQIGRYGCMLFMTFNIPYTYFGLWFDNALTVYLVTGGALLLLYCLGWIVSKKVNGTVKALWLSVTPSVLFLFCGITVSSIPLIVCAILFGVGHITISCKNAKIQFEAKSQQEVL